MKAFLFCLAGVVAFTGCHSKRQDIDASTMIPALKQHSVQDDFKIYSEPSAEKMTVVFRSPATGKAMLSIYYSDGKVYEQRQLVVNKGLNTWDCFCEIKSTGIYVVKFTIDTLERSAKIFKTIS